MALTALDCKNATLKPDGRMNILYDEKGLRLLVRPSGTKSWQFKYQSSGKSQVFTIGTFPELSLKEARSKRDELRRQLAQGIDPQAEKQQQERAARVAAANLFEALTEEWLEIMGAEWAPRHLAGVRTSLQRYVLPVLGKRPISDIAPMEVLALLRVPEKAGKLDTAKRLRERISAIFKLAIATGRCRYNPAADLDRALKSPISKPRAALPYSEAPAFIAEVEANPTLTRQTQLLFKLLVMLGTRIGETVQTEWAHFDLEARTWTIPPEIRKVKHRLKPTAESHAIPLPEQAIPILEELRQLSGSSPFVFPNRDSINRPMCPDTPRVALRRMGFDGEKRLKIDTHGFRATLSTWANEQGYNPDAIERHLSHIERNQVRAAYNRARYSTERSEILQAWADWLEGRIMTVEQLAKT
ncbi:tyrosine-type recombinase/integrase [Crenobacter caeni]|uniref:Integrase arm-type DNA-binding domain-containing protein n=1 Tax=Crenobacter caeni TaxID=2705474 RepID=A0A6B2KNA0_9NEIS|nr:integrase arm-type DNA-binding domain-containing protein [Crenobacter caeni]NDV11712.1 integrase arm-type DNA-binding domain-containing protein [Crenobacter caeni]